MNMSNILSHDNINLLKVVVCRAKDKISTELDGETVILDLASGVYSGLDQVGTTIWNLLEHPVSIGNIVTNIVNTYDVSEKKSLSDLIVFLNSLAENGLIVIQDAENT